MEKQSLHNLEEEETTVAMESTNGLDQLAPDKDTLFMLSGVALMVFGAGLILSNPLVRKYLGQIGIGNLAQGAIPDLDRYLKLRQM
jgi:hypothetical protein